MSEQTGQANRRPCMRVHVPAPLLGSPRASVALLGPRRASVTLLGPPRASVTLLGSPRASVALLGSPRASVALLGPPRASVAGVPRSGFIAKFAALAFVATVDLLCSTPLKAQEPKPRQPADFSAEAMRARLEVLRPDMEAVLGEPFGPIPPIYSTTSAALANILVEEEVVLGRLADPKPPWKALPDGKLIEAQFTATGLLGKVDLATNAIHIRPQAFTVLSLEAEAGPLFLSQDALDLILVHEAVHVFQGRRFSDVALFSRDDADARKVAGAITEGHAQWVTRQVASRRGILDVFLAHRELFEGKGLNPTTEIGQSIIVRLISRLWAFSYLKGEDFFTAAVAALGPQEAFRRAFAECPDSVDDIVAPANWLKRPRDDAPPAAPAVAMRAVRGSMSLGDGSKPKALRVHVWCGAPADRVVVLEGSDGSFGGELPAGSTWLLGLVHADGEVLLDVLGRELAAAEDGTLRIGSTEAKVLRFTVVDAATDLPMAEARIAPADSVLPVAGDASNPFVVPLVPPSRREKSESAATDVQGVAQLPAKEHAGFVVEAQGRARAFVNVPAGSDPGEPLRVELHPGGTLTYTIAGWEKLRGASIYLQHLGRRRDGSFELGSETLVPRPPAGGTDTIDGLPEGVVALSIRQGTPYSNGPLYGSATFEIVAGRTTEVTVETAGAPDKAAMTVRLSAPEAWGRLPRLIAKLECDERLERPLEQVIKWDSERKAELGFKNVPAGKCRLEIPGLPFRSELTAGSGDVTIALPEPVEVVLSFRGATDEEIRRVEAIWKWKAEDDLGAIEFRAQSMLPGGAYRRLEPENGRCRLLLPPGPIELFFKARGYAIHHEHLDVAAPGPLACEIRLVQGGHLEVEFRSGGARHAGERVGGKLRLASKEFGGEYEWSDRGFLRFADMHPGKYVLDVFDVAGFQKVPERELEITSGQTERVTVELVK